MPQHEASTTAEYTLLDQQLMSQATRYFEWQARTTKQHLGQRVIETGCGTGNFTRHLANRELVVSLDVVEECIECARARFGNHPNMQFRLLDVQDPEFLRLKAVEPDTIVCMNVLEHVRDDRLALERMWQVLVPGGRAIFLLPAFEALYGPIDRNLGHFRRYSKNGWRTLAESVGFRVTELRYFNLIGFFGWWTNAHVFRRQELSEWQIALFDRVGVPVLSRLEKWIAPPVGQSIFTVLQKP
jgi:ubiquinone/menaquinone biosynthesis C-methylase UbiE